MAFIGIPITYFPKLEAGTSWGTSGGELVNNGQAVDGIFQIPKSGNIQAFGCLGAARFINVLVTLEFINVDGEPAGKISSLAGRTLTPGSSLNSSTTYSYEQFDGLISVTQGQKVAFKVERIEPADVGTINPDFPRLTAPGKTDFPYYQTISAGGSHAFFQSAMSVALQYEDGSWPQIVGMFGASVFSARTLSAGADVQEAGSKFRLRVNTRSCGFWSKATGGVGDIFTLYDDLDGILFQGTVPNRATGAGSINRLFFPLFLPKNKTFRMTVTRGGTNVVIPTMETFLPTMMTILDGGSDWLYTERTALGQWNDFTSKRAPIGILVDQIDVDNSGGFGYSPPISEDEMLPVMSAMLSEDPRAPTEEPMAFDPYLNDAYPL